MRVFRGVPSPGAIVRICGTEKKSVSVKMRCYANYTHAHKKKRRMSGERKEKKGTSKIMTVIPHDD